MNELNTAAYIISGLIEIFLPIALGYYIIRKLRTSWKIWFIGALMFLVSLIRFPMNTYLTDLIISRGINTVTYWLIALIPSFTAGLFEEISRYAGIRYLVSDYEYESGLTYGAGHGGIESILLVGVNVLTIGLILFSNPESLTATELFSITSVPWYLPLFGAYERVMSIVIQISLSIMVLETLRKNDIKYLVLAVMLHIIVNYLSLSVVSHSILYAEIMITGFAIGLAQWAYTKIKV